VTQANVTQSPTQTWTNGNDWSGLQQYPCTSADISIVSKLNLAPLHEVIWVFEVLLPELLTSAMRTGRKLFRFTLRLLCKWEVSGCHWVDLRIDVDVAKRKFPLIAGNRAPDFQILASQYCPDIIHTCSSSSSSSSSNLSILIFSCTI